MFLRQEKNLSTLGKLFEEPKLCSESFTEITKFLITLEKHMVLILFSNLSEQNKIIWVGSKNADSSDSLLDTLVQLITIGLQESWFTELTLEQGGS